MSIAKRNKYRIFAIAFLCIGIIYGIVEALYHSGLGDFFDFYYQFAIWYFVLPCLLCFAAVLWKHPMSKYLFVGALVFFALDYVRALILSLRYKIEYFEIPLIILYVLSLVIFIILMIEQFAKKKKMSPVLCISGAILYPVLVIVYYILTYSYGSYMDIDTIIFIAVHILTWLALFFIIKYDLIDCEDPTFSQVATGGAEYIMEILRGLKMDYETGRISEEEYNQKKEELLKKI